MDEPARKRRKTTSPGAPERVSSPLKMPPRRPSFASPTKASLARFNPNLLPARPTSSSSAIARTENRGGILNRGKQALSFIFGGDATADQDPIAETEHISSTSVASEEGSARRAASTSDRPRQSSMFGRRSVPLPDMHEEEAELPAHPSSASREEQDVPRRGALFSSPSKRPMRLKGGAKQPPSKMRQPEFQAESVKAPVNVKDSHVQIQIASKKHPPDPELERRKQEKQNLQDKLEALEKDIEECGSVISALQAHSGANRLDSTRLITLIDKMTAIEDPAQKLQPVPVSDLLCSFLPFTAHTVTAPPVKSDNEDKTFSHQPLELQDPLPYLEMFTSFTCTSRIDVVEANRGPQHHDTLRKHTIQMAGPQKLFTTSFEMIVDSTVHEITEMHIRQLPNYAEQELGTFIRRKAEDCELGTVTWAVHSYWNLSKKRAAYWNRCETTFARLLPGRTSSDTENNKSSTQKPTTNISRRDLLRNLGRDVLVFQDNHVHLKLIWGIDFDWTGEAGSKIRVESAFPRAWTEADETSSLAKIPDTFEKLVQTRGVFEATRILIALLFSER